ncbi:MAG TPA: peptidyl-prolyl cis-trans isomerase [Rhodanobacteraceae bacterium]|nr:peptidyl-prolyl cis-trans isomerase [Rhodanobacteraceae bacterium]
MSIFPRVLIVAVLAATLAACAASSGSDKVIQLPDAQGNAAETVNGIAVPQTLLDAIAKGRGLDMQLPQQRQAALDEAAQYVLLAQQAKKLRLQQQPDLAAMIEAARLRGVANATLLAYTRSHPVTDAMVAEDYANQVKEVGDKTYRFSQLLFADKATADKAAAELEAGTPFSKVFDEYSDKARDARAYPNVFPKQLPPPLAEALTSLKPGEATMQPVQTKLGWHLLHLDGVNPFHPPALDAVRDQVRSNLEKKQVAAYIDSLKAKATITAASPARPLSASAPRQPQGMRKTRGPVAKQAAPVAAPAPAVTPPAPPSSR